MENNDRQDAQPQQPVVEEAQAASPQAMDDALAATTEVHDEPGIPQQEQQQGFVEDAPQAAPQEQQGTSVGEYDPGLVPDKDPNMPDHWGHDPRFFPEGFNPGGEGHDPGFVPEGGHDFVEDDPAPVGEVEPDFRDDVADEAAVSGIADEPARDDMLGIGIEDITGTDGLDLEDNDREFSFSDTDGNGIEDRWEEVSPTVSEEPTPGGYDSSGIAGGLDLDQDGVFDQIENNPDVPQPSYPGNDPVGEHEGNVTPDEGEIAPDMSDEDYSYDEDAYEDAEDAFEDLQDALQDGDEEDRAEALEELQDYLGGFDEDDEDQENDSHNHGDEVDSRDKEPVGERDEAGNNPDMSDKDAEEAFEDLREALQNGDEEDRAEALEELQDYLGGFDKGAEDEENAPHNHGDPEKLPNTVDKEPADAPDASGAAVSGAAVGGVAVGAGAADEAIDAATEWAGDAIDDALGIDGAGEVLDDIVSGDFDGALDTAAGLAGGAIDDALGIEGAGEVLDGVVDGDWDKVTDALPDLIGEGVEEHFGIEGAGDAFEDILEGDWDELGDHIGEAAGSFVGNVLGGPVGAAIGEEIGEFVGDGVGDAVTEELGDIADHIENGEYDELAGDALALGAGTVGGFIFGEDGAAVGQEIGEAVGDAASEVVEDVGEVVEDVGEALEDAGEAIADFFGW